MNEKQLLQVGDVIELKEGHKVYTDIAEHFVYANKVGSFKSAHEEVKLGGRYGAQGGLDTSYLMGRYVVIKTRYHGGGTGMGPHDVFPDGHHVYCEKIIVRAGRGRITSDFKIYVDFFQTGCFTAMIPDIEPVGKVGLTYVMEDIEPQPEE